MNTRTPAEKEGAELCEPCDVLSVAIREDVERAVGVLEYVTTAERRAA